jgi:TMEM175 potassium channel family protein
VTKNRVEAFSDGVFAIVITLLVIELRPPDVGKNESLADALWNLWPNYLAYFVSFAVIGVMWLNHHRIFELVQVVDGVLLALNLNLLLWMALIPFPTAVVADYLRAGGTNARTAVAFYSLVVLLAAIAYTMLYTWIVRDERIMGVRIPPDVLKAARIRFGIGVLFYVLALGLSFLAPYVALTLHGVMALYYLFDQASVAATEPAP